MNVRAKPTTAKPATARKASGKSATAKKAAPRKTAPKSTKPNALLFMALKNEAPFIVEWVAYHRAIGFDRIVIYSNHSDDGSTEILDALAADGVIEHYTHDPQPGTSAQANAARLANERGVLKGADWGIWLDADEFLVISAGDGSLQALIDVLGNRDGILIPWRMMGDGGNDRFPGRFVSEDFTDAAAAAQDGNLRLKTFFRNGPHIEGFAENGIHRPKLHEGGSHRDFAYITATGNPLDLRHRPHLRWMGGADMARTSKMPPNEHGYALAQINHYAVRTPEHFALKRARGRGWQADQAGEENQRHTPEFYLSMNRADTTDRRILAHEAATTAEIARLMAAPALAAAVAEADARHAARLADIPQDFLDACVAARPERAEPRDFPLTLPEDEAALLRSEYAKADVVLEYGSGGSSFVALDSGAKALFTVESDRTWALTIHDALQTAFPDAHFTVNYADIGVTKAWGKPANSDGFATYARYSTGVWDLAQFQQPDVVLIDGRFRVACFLTTLFRTQKPVTVLFDDYLPRADYHWIEKYAKPERMAGRMACFRVKPMAIPAEDLTQITAAYANPG